MFLHQSTLDLLSAKGNSQSIWFVNYSALEKMDSLDAMEGKIYPTINALCSAIKAGGSRSLSFFCLVLMEPYFVTFVFSGDVELEWEETTM